MALNIAASRHFLCYESFISARSVDILIFKSVNVSVEEGNVDFRCCISLSVHLCVYLSVCLSVHLFVCLPSLSACQFILPYYIFIILSFYLSIYLFIYLSIYLFIHLLYQDGDTCGEITIRYLDDFRRGAECRHQKITITIAFPSLPNDYFSVSDSIDAFISSVPYIIVQTKVSQLLNHRRCTHT